MLKLSDNKRITPDTGNIINPDVTASPVDKRQQFAINPLDNIKRKAIVDALADIGSGVQSLDTTFQENAVYEAFKLYQDTGGADNRQDWKIASKQLQGMAKFNPYIQDEYKKLVAKDVINEGVLKLNANTKSYALSNKEYEDFIQDIKSKTQIKLNLLNLQPQHYIESFKEFEDTIQSARNNYVVKNAEYNYKNLLNREAYDFNIRTVNAVLKADSKEAKSEAFNTEWQNTVEKCNDLGTPDTDIANLLQTSIQNFIIENPSLMDSKTMLLAFSNLKVNDKSISELIPDFNSKAALLIKEAKRADYNDKYLAFQQMQLEDNVNYKNALGEFIENYSNNPNMTSSEVKGLALELIKKYGIKANGFSFLSQAASLDNYINKSPTENSKIVEDLTLKSITDELSIEDVVEELRAGNIKPSTANAFYTKIKSGEANAKSEAVEQVKYIAKMVEEVKKNRRIGTKNSEIDSSFITQLDNIKNQVMINELDPIKGASMAKELIRAYTAYSKFEKQPRKIDDLLNPVYLKELPSPTYNESEGEKFFKRKGLIREDWGKVFYNITSLPQKSRTLNGKTKQHSGTDIAAPIGSRLFNPWEGAFIKYAGFEPTMGNYAIIEFKNKGAIRIMHLQNSIANRMGTYIAKGENFARIGNTGTSTGPHLHIEFYDKNMFPVTPMQFDVLMK